MYRIDPRFGTNEDYYNLVDKAHAKGIKVIMDHVVNHIGLYHPFQANSRLSSELNTNLPAVTDFGLFEAFGRDQDINEFYSFIGKDFLYSDPNNLVTFIDNHDVMRLMDLVDRDLQRYIMALKMLLTMRGIPQIYYGTEIGLTGGKHHGEIRCDFPGGFTEDTRDAFTAEGRTEVENADRG